MNERKRSPKRAPDPLTFARDAKRAVSALVRDSLALASADHASRGEGTVVPATTGKLLGIARKPRHRAPMELLDAVEISVERGLAGNADGRPGRRQVTVLTREGWEAACRELAREVVWQTRRANLLVEGLALERRVGARLVIGAVVLEITGETTPCANMDAQAPGLTRALNPDWRAGVTCRVLQGGAIRVGDVVTLEGP